MNEAVEYIEKSFLSPLLKNQNITDISYNGKDIFYQDNLHGRNKSEVSIDENAAMNFIRQIANLTDSMFSFTNPILDVSCGKYRINATHPAISRKNREKVINFSIRIGYEDLRIQKNNDFITDKCLELIELIIKKRFSIVISGTTSSGKTELQKFLISRFEPNTRVLVIDNVEELEVDRLNDNLDIQTWLLKENVKLTFDDLVKNALRANPDWLIVSEARGGEMLSLLNSAMTGHPTISTIHSKEIEFDYDRMTRMCMIQNSNLKFDDTIADIYDHFKLLIHVKKEIRNDGTIKRYVKEIGTNFRSNYRPLYRYPNEYLALPISFKKDLGLSNEEYEKMKEVFKCSNE